MQQYFAFLRAINVGGHIVKMDDLRQHFTSLGFEKVETFIASGNVIFHSNLSDIETMEKFIEGSLREKYGFQVATFIRMPQELIQAVARQPFPPDAFSTAVAFNLAFLKQPIEAEALRRLKELENTIDRFEVVAREFYWLCLVKQSESKFANVSLEKIVGQPSTMRQMSTLRKLVAKYCV